MTADDVGARQVRTAGSTGPVIQTQALCFSYHRHVGLEEMNGVWIEVGVPVRYYVRVRRWLREGLGGCHEGQNEAPHQQGLNAHAG
jgi:hypothetical protein